MWVLFTIHRKCLRVFNRCSPIACVHVEHGLWSHVHSENGIKFILRGAILNPIRVFFSNLTGSWKEINKARTLMNADEGVYQLSHLLRSADPESVINRWRHIVKTKLLSIWKSILIGCEMSLHRIVSGFWQKNLKLISTLKGLGCKVCIYSITVTSKLVHRGWNSLAIIDI